MHVTDDLDADQDGASESGVDFMIKYEVPVKNASRSVQLSMKLSFSRFLEAVAHKMEVGIRFLANIAYIPSWLPKNSKPLPKLLQNDEDYEAMLVEIEEFIAKCESANKGKGQVKPFSICIVDTSEGVAGDSKGVRASHSVIARET